MTTAERPTALSSLRRARELFLRGQQPPDGVPEDVLAAWKRARFFGVRHDVGSPAPEAAGPVDSPLLTAARPVLDRIAGTLGGGDTALLLTDARLRVLWAGGLAPDHLCRDLSEERVGHNSAALALHTRRRAEVHGPEHFLDRWQDVSAVSVPVRAPETGQPVGTVTVAGGLCGGGGEWTARGERTEYGPHPGASLAEAVAAAVETELLARTRTAERGLLDAYARAVGEQGQAVVALDGRNRLVSEAAGRLLSPEALEALERRAVALIRESDSGHPAGLADGHPDASAHPTTLTDRHPEGAAHPTTLTDRHPEGAAHPTTLTDGHPDASAHPTTLPYGPDGAAASLTPVSHQGSVIGVVVVLESSGCPAPVAVGRRDLGLAGGSVPWRHAVGRALELAASGEPLLLVGERGTGKTSLARALVADALLVDAAETELGADADVLRTGRPLLVRHVERLAPPDTATLNSLLAAHPNVPLLVTYTPGASPGPCLQRLLDTLAARSVTLPALRERPDDIRELLTFLTPGPRPGHPPLTWSLDALRALERHPWPGNVTELAHLVRTLAEHRRTTGPVRRSELPDAVREGPAPRPLTPMELAERSAILDALHLHGGNKARAAASLGIARATLYRKLRGYRD
ncbi:regulatory Fis family protein [Streptomyces sp. TLI_55]|uniref:helix-turn-helix domain-containing protein n=1 Tax=Streptomyces sp. TLI_55 TaxID=1938861 RepID=UPI000BDCC6B4|nr:helix-turn-helix domain-containing protein [Streptomyces sp. TLI_55]SNX56509.1 regulatory Fis family protein [Streptomyces sp. TLI_55]